MPGIPGVLIGKTPYVAWGITMTLSDLTDFYVMEPDPVDPSKRYMYRGQSLPYTFLTETIKVAGNSDQSHTIRITVLGPIVGFDTDMTVNHYIAVNSTVLLDDPTSIAAFLDLVDTTKTRTVTDVRDVFRRVQAPGLSLTMSDSTGGIGYVSSGLHPIRAKGHSGRLPVLGNGSYDILGYVPMNQLPAKIDSNTAADAWLRCANEKMYPDGYPYSLGYDWAVSYRADRLTSALSGAPSSRLSSVAFHQSLQLDMRSNIWADKMRPGLLTLGTAFTSQLTPTGVAWWNQMMAWNNISSIGAAEPSFFWQWMVEVGKLPKKALAAANVYTWFPDAYPARVILSPSSQMLAMCSAETSGKDCVAYAAAKWNDVAKLAPAAWGRDLNRLYIDHPVFTATFLSCLFNHDTEKGGDRSSLNVADEANDRMDSSLPVREASSMRQAWDWSTPAKAYFTQPGGQSGHPWSSNYLSLLTSFNAQVYNEVPLDGSTAVHFQRLLP